MLAKTFSVMMFISCVSAVITGNVDRMSAEFITSLSDAVSLCISLLGMMCFWSGLMNVVREAGFVAKISRLLGPFLSMVYGKAVSDRENLENLSACISASFLGLGNAALPLGIKTVRGFEKNNKDGVASDGTILFAVLNTVPFQLVPSTLIAMRTKYGSINPFDVVPYIWISSAVIICFAVAVCKIMSRFWRIK